MRRRRYRVRSQKKLYRTVYQMTEEERAKRRPKNLNGGRPPERASKEQLAAWRKDMARRKEFRVTARPPLPVTY
jgi:hypothetical protein